MHYNYVTQPTYHKACILPYLCTKKLLNMVGPTCTYSCQLNYQCLFINCHIMTPLLVFREVWTYWPIMDWNAIAHLLWYLRHGAECLHICHAHNLLIYKHLHNGYTISTNNNTWNMIVHISQVCLLVLLPCLHLVSHTK